VAIAPIVVPRLAQAHRYSAWRSRATTCVAGTGTRPSRSPTRASTRGSTFEYVPTAPDSLHTATEVRAARNRARSRSTCRAHSATFAPNVVSSACMPCVRPIIGVSAWRLARATSAATSPSVASRIRSAASRSIEHHAVSTTSELVSPWCSQAPSGMPMAACDTSTNAATSWSVVRSRSATAATNAASTLGARARHAAAAARGTVPMSACASTASSSISR